MFHHTNLFISRKYNDVYSLGVMVLEMINLQAFPFNKLLTEEL